ARYMEFLEEARWVYCEENGIFERLFSAKGISHAVVGITINCRRRAGNGNSLRIVTGVLRKGKSSYTMGQRIYLENSDVIVADAQVTNVLLDHAGSILPIDEEIDRLWPDLMEISGK
ncbi:MAG: acyl-CoA thioesterase, partial [Deltaproteobacteria bacterium]|nr:acyl-CoA thioesterase [Deltaproteobacteria bacterium]